MIHKLINKLIKLVENGGHSKNIRRDKSIFDNSDYIIIKIPSCLVSESEEKNIRDILKVLYDYHDYTIDNHIKGSETIESRYFKLFYLSITGHYIVTSSRSPLVIIFSDDGKFEVNNIEAIAVHSLNTIKKSFDEWYNKREEK